MKTAETESEEREQISAAVALMERIVGPKSNTQNDRARNEGETSKDPQLDCVAETANTTVSLLMMQEQGLFKWHRVIYPKLRGFNTEGETHNSAAIEGLQSGEQYVVDSWFFKNGREPVIVPARLWRNGYDPEESTPVL
jgi:hypothetical protein